MNLFNKRVANYRLANDVAKKFIHYKQIETEEITVAWLNSPHCPNAVNIINRKFVGHMATNYINQTAILIFK